MKKISPLVVAFLSLVSASSMIAAPSLVMPPAATYYSHGVNLTWSVNSRQITNDGLEECVSCMITVENDTSYSLNDLQVLLLNQKEAKIVGGPNIASVALDGMTALYYGRALSSQESGTLFYSMILPAGAEIQAPQFLFSSPSVQEDPFSGTSW